MMCVLRVAGSELDIDAILKETCLTPDRVDRKGVGRSVINSLHYELNDADSVSELLNHVDEFLLSARADLKRMRTYVGLEFFVLDFGLTIESEMVVISLSIDNVLLSKIVELGLSISVSSYKA